MSGLFEYAGNMHMHTPYSDGEKSHADIAIAARAAGLDYIIVTDHNVLVQGVEGYYGDADTGYVLLLTGEEIHDRTRQPQANHLLVYGAEMELCQCASDPQALIDATSAAGGLSFLAHPHDPSLKLFNEPPIPWEDWHVRRYTGLEVWNYMSGFKAVLNTGPRKAIRYAFQPEDGMVGPPPETLALWDNLLSEGYRAVGIGGSDAHGTTFRVGPFKHTVFPYDFLFSCVNTHILSAQAFTGDWQKDKLVIYRALKLGNAFISYDLIGNARGFRYSAHGQNGSAIMGGTLRVGLGVTLQAVAHDHGKIRLIRNGHVVAESTGRENLMYTARKGGAYRIEIWRKFRGKDRLWILSNPIYLEDADYIPHD